MDSVEKFLKTVIRENCKCYQKECRVSEIPESVESLLNRLSSDRIGSAPNPTCFQIFSDTTVEAEGIDPQDYRRTYLDYLNHFVDLGLLTKSKLGIYTLPGYKALKWSTIILMNKTSGDIPDQVVSTFRDAFNFNDTDVYAFIKVLFWFLRKGVVDNILKQILATTQQSKNYMHVALSVGSTRVTSDYDVTVYGPVTGYVATHFNQIISQLFSRQSSIVFDCNIYGASFIEMLPINPTLKQHYVEGGCNDKVFWYLKESTTGPSDQHVWALFKLLGSTTNLSPRNKQSQKKLKFLSELHTKLKSIQIDYSKFITYGKTRQIGTMEALDGLLNIISAINFKGEETYYTRGTFLDVVVNGQMCSNTPVVPLSVDALLDSLVENLADYIQHPDKTKYLTRIGNVLNNPDSRSLFDNVTFRDIKENLQTRKLNDSANTLVDKLLMRIDDRSVERFKTILSYMKEAPKKLPQYDKTRVIKGTNKHPQLDIETGKSQFFGSSMDVITSKDNLASSDTIDTDELDTLDPAERDFRKLSAKDFMVPRWKSKLNLVTKK